MRWWFSKTHRRRSNCSSWLDLMMTIHTRNWKGNCAYHLLKVSFTSWVLRSVARETTWGFRPLALNPWRAKVDQRVWLLEHHKNARQTCYVFKWDVVHSHIINPLWGLHKEWKHECFYFMLIIKTNLNFGCCGSRKQEPTVVWHLELTPRCFSSKWWRSPLCISASCRHFWNVSLELWIWAPTLTFLGLDLLPRSAKTKINIGQKPKLNPFTG